MLACRAFFRSSQICWQRDLLEKTHTLRDELSGTILGDGLVTTWTVDREKEIRSRKSYAEIRGRGRLQAAMRKRAAGKLHGHHSELTVCYRRTPKDTKG